MYDPMIQLNIARFVDNFVIFGYTTLPPKMFYLFPEFMIASFLYVKGGGNPPDG